MKNLFLYLALACFTFSCVPREKMVYLQDKGGIRDISSGTIIEGFKIQEFEYRLKPEDIVSIKVTTLTSSEYNFFAESERQIGGQPNPLLTGYLIDKDGYIQLPVVDKVLVQGLTISEAQDKLKSALDSYLQSPNVILKLLSFHYTVVGEIKSPGRYTTYNNKINILEALGSAGDFTDYADRSQIKVVRYEGNNASIFYVNILEDKLLNSPYFYLQPGDFIAVPPLKVKNIRLYGIQNATVAFSTITAITLIIWRFSRGNN